MSVTTAGAIVEILFAPDKGSKTRRRINEKGNKIADGVKNKFRKGKNKLNELKEDIVQTVNEKAEAFN